MGRGLRIVNSETIGNQVNQIILILLSVGYSGLVFKNKQN